MPVIRSTEGIEHDVHGATFTAYANSRTGASELCAWTTRIPAGQPGMPHQVSREELLLVTSGAPRFTIDGTAVNARPGDVVVVPADSMLTVEGGADQDSTMWVTTSRGLTAKLADGSDFTPPWAQ
ncbi:cupin domain-containing protein [Actinospica sp.]|jgi:quercetin dioxygenase-like cupin family protein|uniref:cupin domain-containing protein n=1 Tax=Actinospica sp. TaxID=1872142 RepID=UPI002C414722|nr:cupin domain-containing protein [Actinospica sp.]HWG25463.1 cupin domain-containing protein [Actinospica sp.]